MVVLVVFVLDVVVYTRDLLQRTTQLRPFLSRITAYSTFCKVLMSSPNDLSALYLTLFQWNVFKYASAGSGLPVRDPCVSKPLVECTDCH